MAEGWATDCEDPAINRRNAYQEAMLHLHLLLETSCTSAAMA